MVERKKVGKEAKKRRKNEGKEINGMIEDIIEVLYPGHTEVGEYGTVADRRDWRDDEIAKLRREYDKKQFPVDHGVDIIGDEYE